MRPPLTTKLTRDILVILVVPVRLVGSRHAREISPGKVGSSAALVQADGCAVIRQSLLQALQLLITGRPVVEGSAVTWVYAERLRVVCSRSLKVPLHDHNISDRIFIMVIHQLVVTTKSLDDCQRWDGQSNIVQVSSLIWASLDVAIGAYGSTA